MDRQKVVELVVASLSEILSQLGDEGTGSSVSESTCLSGPQQVIDSFWLVSLIVTVEKQLSERSGVTIAIAGERALSREESPFGTVGTLADYICILLEEARTA